MSDATFTVTIDGEENEYDLTDDESALGYIESYAENLNEDENFTEHLSSALSKVRESIKSYATLSFSAACNRHSTGADNR